MRETGLVGVAIRINIFVIFSIVFTILFFVKVTPAIADILNIPGSACAAYDNSQITH